MAFVITIGIIWVHPCPAWDGKFIQQILCALPAPAPGHSYSLLFPGTSLRLGSIEIMSITNPAEGLSAAKWKKIATHLHFQ